jgi:3-phosphoshikimate 1-carboxyvinyltransferase
MTALLVHPADKPLTGSVPVPSDKDIGLRALLMGALCHGKTQISGLTDHDDSASMARCLRALGVAVREAGSTELVIDGVGLEGLRAPEGALDCGGSGTTLGLLCSVLAGQSFRAQLIGEASLARRPVTRIVAPLRSRGAVIDGRPHSTRDGELTTPLVIGPRIEGRRLASLEYESTIASEEIKSALLFSGLFAEGLTIFKEPTVSRDHTERLLDALGVPIRTAASVVQLDPTGWDGQMPAFAFTVPGDLSAAAFALAAAQTVPGSRVTVRGVGINPTRSGWLEIARDMGAGIAIESQGDRGGEPVAVVHSWGAPLRAVRVGGETVTRAIDDIAVACALAARATGTTRISGAQILGQPRRGESDPFAQLINMLRAFGVGCEGRPDGLDIEGRIEPLDPADVETGGDPRIAMTAAVLALGARAPSRVRDAGSIAATYPKFVATLRALGARIDVQS